MEKITPKILEDAVLKAMPGLQVSVTKHPNPNPNIVLVSFDRGMTNKTHDINKPLDDCVVEVIYNAGEFNGFKNGKQEGFELMRDSFRNLLEVPSRRELNTDIEDIRDSMPRGLRY